MRENCGEGGHAAPRPALAAYLALEASSRQARQKEEVTVI